MKKRLTGLGLMLLACCSMTFAQNSITGKVLDDKNKAMNYVNVLLLQTSDSSLVKGSITDSTGQYLLENIDDGEYLVSASMMGYGQSYSVPFVVNGNNKTIPNLSLSESSVDMEQVTVTATKPFIELQADKIVVNVEGSAVMAGNNALEVLRKSPGVIVDNDNNVTLKGRQGVLVMIDGKQTYLSTEEVARMLETMPASNISSIEIINNPSARYDAAGNAGIINIKLKKDKSIGLNGNIQLEGGLGLYTDKYGPFEKLNGSIRLNYRQKKFNLFGNYNHWNSEGWNTNNIKRTIPFNDEITNFDQNIFRTNHGYSERFQVGADFFLTDKTIVGVLAQGHFGTWNNIGDNDTYITGDFNEPFSHLKSNSVSKNNWNNQSFNLNFKHDFGKGKELTFDTDYSFFRSVSDADYFNYYFDDEEVKSAPDDPLMNDDRSDVDIVAAKIDYVHPIDEKTSFEIGAKSSFVTTDNAVNFFVTDSIGDWIVDNGRTNTFVYEENIHAAYLNFNKKFEKFNLQAGLRGELTDALGNSVTLDTTVDRSYFNLFPSLSISHEIGEKHSMSYSYSRRIDRPTYQDLNPFLFFLDQYTFERGNPLLQPQYTDALSVTYGFQNMAFATVNYSITNNAMTEIALQDDSLKLTFQTEDNLARVDNFSLNLSTPIPVKEWWMIRVNLTGFYNHFQADFPDYSVDTKNWAGNFYVSNNFTINKKIRAELSGSYQTAMTYGIIDMTAQYGVDAGFNIKILDGKGKLSVNANDILNTRRFGGMIQQGNIDASIMNNWESRKVFVSFSYSFGNSEVKPNRRRKTATSEEQNRVK